MPPLCKWLMRRKAAIRSLDLHVGSIPQAALVLALLADILQVVVLRDHTSTHVCSRMQDLNILLEHLRACTNLSKLRLPRPDSIRCNLSCCEPLMQLRRLEIGARLLNADLAKCCPHLTWLSLTVQVQEAPQPFLEGLSSLQELVLTSNLWTTSWTAPKRVPCLTSLVALTYLSICGDARVELPKSQQLQSL